MDTVEQAVDYLHHNKTPFWWIRSGNNKIGDNTDEADLNASVEQFRKTVQFLPPGQYKLECSRNPKDRSGSYLFPFTKGTSAQTSNPMQAAPSTNVYGISDAVVLKIQEETRQRILLEQMHGDFMAFIKDWPEYRKKIDALHNYMKDDDDDGTPDFLEMTRKASDTVQAASEMKKVFSGGSGFRL
ncbi:hypothetical protein [Spirosoma endbachense]|uniref:Uncharacterized protein n=1 Tax=Spirosoma endbachense TaxID=2666025 RepID=A0A6P1W1L9_9BACT|nr:hypothetical protein [Spirosoma endbachense]QHV97566.1 hypothetical protein GJR95_22280 [Spirosoma endbachense]